MIARTESFSFTQITPKGKTFEFVYKREVGK